MSAPIRFAMIGAGGIANGHSESFAGMDDATVVAVADIDPEAAQRIAAQHDAEVYADHLSLMDQAKPDAILICTPPLSHADITHDALDRGVAVLCEKPFTIDVRNARRLYNRAHEEGHVLTMASKFRFVEDVIAARAMIQKGDIGEPVIFENAFTSHVDMSNRWNADPAVSGGGVMIDNGTHSADIVRYLIGPITEVMAIEGKRLQGLRVEDTAKMFLQTANGVMASVDLSWSLDKSLDHFIWVFGTEGEIRVGWRESSIRKPGGDWEQFGTGYGKIAAMQAQLQNMVDHLRDGEDLVITVEDALSSVGVIEAAYSSLKSNEWRSVSTRVNQRGALAQ